MMATESSVEKPAEVSASPEPRPAEQAPHVALDTSMLNGKPASNSDEASAKRIVSIEDQIHSADVSVSGGSDTDASRADWSRQKDGDRGHVRSASSAKKLTTFKAVSVNKKFLASKASPSNAVQRPNDKLATGSSTPPPASITPSASRPRLIAKTGSGARETAPRLSSVVNGGKAASAPDPSAVWNKNRPPEPKKLTDEELKKYGIHVASRLNEDDSQGQNKWADIDDDDDDWAPETITWGDGTRTTLPHPDEQPPTVPDSRYSPPVPKNPEIPRPPATLSQGAPDNLATQVPQGPQAAQAIQGSPTIAPVTSLSKASNLSSGRGLVLKSASMDKPAQVPKPPAAPNAAFKSPWATLPPVERASPALAEISSLIRGPPPQPPALRGAHPKPKEIAADDFSRSGWRDGPLHGNRELYNSHSGRYEPVADRRGSMRLDSQPKQPALLQRPLPQEPPSDQSGTPATNRTSHDSTSSRRRGSSSVSVGSSQRTAGKIHDGSVPSQGDLAGPRRPSQASSIEGHIGSGISAAGPVAQAQPKPLPDRHSKAASGHTMESSPQGSQPPEAKTSSTSSAEPTVDEAEFQKKLMRERVELARKRRQEEEAREEAARRERIQRKLDALGPAPDKKSDKKSALPRDDPPKPTQIQQRNHQEPTRASVPGVTQEGNTKLEVGASITRDAVGLNSLANSSKNVPSPAIASRRLSHTQEGKRTDPWVSTGPRPDKFASWAAEATVPLRSVWGSPDIDRGLGNGTFDPDLGRIPDPSLATLHGPKGSSPIVAPRAGQAPSQEQAQPPAGLQGSRYAAPGSDLARKWVAAVIHDDNKSIDRTEQEGPLVDHGPDTKTTQPVLKDSWRPVHLPGDGTRRLASGAETRQHQYGLWKPDREKPAEGSAQAHETGISSSLRAGVIGSSKSSILSQTGSGTSSQPRISRFFPAAKDSHLNAASTADPSCPASPSPPPPTMEGHPAYEGNALRPNVSLPKPQPVVKLPPALMASQSTHPRTHWGWAGRGPSRDLANAHGQGEAHGGSWQDKFNSLFNGGKVSSHKQMGVEPASRNTMDHILSQDPSVTATVSLPDMPAAHRTVKQTGFMSKPMAEECFEEQEMGSLPQVRIPHNPPDIAWPPAAAPIKPFPRRFLVQASLMEPCRLPTDLFGSGSTTKVRLPGMKEARVVPRTASVPRAARASHSRSSARHRGSGQGSRSGKKEAFSPRSGPRGRGSDNWSKQARSQSQLSTQSKTKPKPSPSS